MRIAAIILFAITCLPAWAQHECQGGHNCNDKPDVVPGFPALNVATDVVTNNEIAGDRYSSKGLALSHALGDVDIAQCLASTQWSFLIAAKQKVILNLWCAAEVYDAKGMYQNAARSRCSIGEIAQWYSSWNGCLAGEEWIGPPQPPPDLGDLYDQAAQYAGDIEVVKPEYFEEYEQKAAQQDEMLAELLDWRSTIEASQRRRQAQPPRTNDYAVQQSKIAQEILDSLPPEAPDDGN